MNYYDFWTVVFGIVGVLGVIFGVVWTVMGLILVQLIRAIIAEKSEEL